MKRYTQQLESNLHLPFGIAGPQTSFVNLDFCARLLKSRFMAGTIVNPKAVEVPTLAQRVASQYFSHYAAMYIARDPRSDAFAPPVEQGTNRSSSQHPSPRRQCDDHVI
jgi:hypothetical protein